MNLRNGENAVQAKKKPLKMTDFDKLHVNNFMFKPCIPLESQYNCILIHRVFIQRNPKKFNSV